MAEKTAALTAEYAKVSQRAAEFPPDRIETLRLFAQPLRTSRLRYPLYGFNRPENPACNARQ